LVEGVVASDVFVAHHIHVKVEVHQRTIGIKVYIGSGSISKQVKNTRHVRSVTLVEHTITDDFRGCGGCLIFHSKMKCVKVKTFVESVVEEAISYFKLYLVFISGNDIWQHS
jgi:hypothetical protein